MDDVVRCEAEGELSLCVLTGYRAYDGDGMDKTDGADNDVLSLFVLTCLRSGDL